MLFVPAVKSSDRDINLVVAGEAFEEFSELTIVRLGHGERIVRTVHHLQMLHKCYTHG